MDYKSELKEEIGLLEILKILLKYKKLFLVSFFIAAFVSILISFFIFKTKAVYEMKASFYSPVPVSIFQAACSEVMTGSDFVISGRNNIYYMTLHSAEKGKNALNFKKFLEILKNKYLPLLDKSLQRSLDNLHNKVIGQINLAGYDYHIYLLDQTEEILVLEKPFKKILIFIFAFLFFAGLIDIVYIVFRYLFDKLK